MKYLIALQNKFWQKWQSEYLSELREQHKERSDKGSKSMNREIQEGELVIIQEDSLPKGQWRMRLVEQLLRSQDGVIRGAEVKVVTRNGKTNRLRRPVTKLCPLEVRRSFPSSNTTKYDFSDSEENRKLTQKRPPRRQVAIQGELIRRIVNSDELRGSVMKTNFRFQ